MDIAGLDRWLERYAAAWRDRDADAAAVLFTVDGVYRSAPLRDPHEGRERIREYWAWEPGAHEDLTLRFGAPVLDGQRAAVEWWATMLQDGTPVTGPGCLVLRFGADGLCEELREYWHEGPGTVEPPPGWGR